MAKYYFRAKKKHDIFFDLQKVIQIFLRFIKFLTVFGHV